MPDRRAHLLTNAVRHYPWGSHTVLPLLLGAEGPADEPWAEVWMGAHPLEPSSLPDGRSLADVEPGLPFLVKLLAAEDPLSIQAHPDRDRAGAGFAAEEALGVERSAPHRSYKDPNHKPELLVALEPTEVLCGFRSILAIRGVAHGLGSAAWQELVEQTCGPGSDDATGLRALLTELLSCSGPHLAGLVADVLAAAGQLSPDTDPALSRAVGWVRRLAERHAGDPGVLAPLLLELVALAPGDGLFVAAGVLHSYLHGAGVEVQASSDNVLRGGLTTKHVDVPELLRAVRFVPAAPDQRVTPRPVGAGLLAYDVPAEDFAVWRASPHEVPAGEVALATSGPAIVVALGGRVVVGGVDLGPGRSAYVPGSGEIVVGGAGTCLVASTP
jgi:mannose-6-phosphate isomerase